jgi:hypothetical protein
MCCSIFTQVVVIRSLHAKPKAVKCFSFGANRFQQPKLAPGMHPIGRKSQQKAS